MALISCPECQGNISDLARACPHCGRPMQADYSDFQLWRIKVLRVSMVLCVIGVLWGVWQLVEGHSRPGTAIYVLALGILGVTIGIAKLYQLKKLGEKTHRSP